MNLYLIVAGAFLLLVLALIVFCKLYSLERKKNKELKKTIENQKNNNEHLVNHAEKVADIEKKKTEDLMFLEEATDEDAKEILDNVVATNNSRVQNNSSSKKSSSTNTKKSTTRKSKK